jgi:hypothetical protein
LDLSQSLDKATEIIRKQHLLLTPKMPKVEEILKTPPEEEMEDLGGGTSSGVASGGAMVFELIGTGDGTEDEELRGLATVEQGVVSFIIDTGASGNILSVEAAEALARRGFLKTINPDIRKKYRVASGHFIETSSEAVFEGIPELAAIGLASFRADVLEGEEKVPNLLGSESLAQIGATIEVGKGQMSREINGKKKPIATKRRGQHMILEVDVSGGSRKM